MKNILLLSLLLLCICAPGALAQSDQCYFGYFGEIICPNAEDFPPDNGTPLAPGISSGGMLPPPGCTQVNPCSCPPIPPEPPPRPVLYAGGTIWIYPRLVAHTYYNTPPGCATYTWEFD
jgi:hypothetical protein